MLDPLQAQQAQLMLTNMSASSSDTDAQLRSVLMASLGQTLTNFVLSPNLQTADVPYQRDASQAGTSEERTLNMDVDQATDVEWIDTMGSPQASLPSG